jgi:pimeloyl-ACP methyl ester carboxylesterase
VAGADHVLGTDNVRAMAQRAGAQIVEVEGASHAVMVSRPEAVVDLIGAAVASLTAVPPRPHTAGH